MVKNPSAMRERPGFDPCVDKIPGGSVLFSSVTQSRLTLCFLMHWSTPGFSVHLQVTRLPCPSSTPGACLNSHLSSQWYYLTISSCHSHLLSSVFPSIRVFSSESVFTSGGQSIASTSASVLPMNIQDWFPLGLPGLILQSKGLSGIVSNTTVQKH